MKRETPRYWRPLVRAPRAALEPEPQAAVAATMEAYGIDEAAARKRINDHADECEYWVNDLFQIEVSKCGAFVHLDIRRRDGSIDLRDWRHFQQIKNEIVGEECEGIELYPAESRKVDTANRFHLWVCTDPTFRFPFGSERRSVDYQSSDARVPSLRQRPL
jgi:hypothetical protein